MSLLSILQQQVAAITNWMNEVISNSKTNEELPEMNPIDEDALLRVSKEG